MKIFTDAFLSEFKPLSVIIIKYGRISKNKDSKTKPLRKDVRKGKNKKKTNERTPSIKEMGRNKWKYTKICSPKARKEASQKETGKTTIHKVSHFKIRPSLLAVHKGKGQTVRVVRHNYELDLRALDKARKEKRKVGRA